MDLKDLHAAQAARWRAADPLLPSPMTPRAGAVTTLDGAAVARHSEIGPDVLAASWSALRQFRMNALVAGPSPAAALGRLLDLWDAGIATHCAPDDDDSAAEVLWPSRDTAPVLAFTRRGFMPSGCVAVRRTGGAQPGTARGVSIRPLTGSDVAVAAALHLELIRYDAQFGKLTARASTAARIVENTQARADLAEPTAWLAERDGRAVGLVVVDLPAGSGWVAALCGRGPVGYLATAVVDPAERGQGVGRALDAHADAVLQAAGATVTLLHHVLPNPLSTPFWNRAGYRPLWTIWQRRPAIRTGPSVPPPTVHP